jgi:hypothetical protein
MRTVGYVGTIEVETEGHDRIWFSMTERDTGSDWVQLDGQRAWFQMWVNGAQADRPVEMAKLGLLVEAMRERQEVAVYHPDTPHAGISRQRANDTFDANKIRTLRLGISF